MKQTLWLGLVAAVSLPLTSGYAQLPASTGSKGRTSLPRAEAAPVKFSTNVLEVLKLVRTGINEDVILAHIWNSPTGFNLTPTQARYLQDHGLSLALITAMLNRDVALKPKVQPGQLVYRTAVQSVVNPNRDPLPKSVTPVHVPAVVEAASLPAQGPKSLPKSTSKRVSSSQRRAPDAPVPSVFEDPSRPTFPALEDKSDKPWELYPMHIRLQTPAEEDSSPAPEPKPEAAR